MSPRLQGALLVALPIVATNGLSSDTQPNYNANCMREELAAAPVLQIDDTLQMSGKSLELTVCAVAPGPAGGDDYSLVAVEVRSLNVLLVKRSNLEGTLEDAMPHGLEIGAEKWRPDLRAPWLDQTSALDGIDHPRYRLGTSSAAISAVH